MNSNLPAHTVLKVEAKEDFHLLVDFADGSKKLVDMRPVIAEGKVFVPLQNPGFFALAKENYGTVTWPKNLDIAPEYLYEHGVDV